MRFKLKSKICTAAVITLALTGCLSPKPVAPQFSKDWLTLPPGATYTNQSSRTERWANEGVIREKDESILWLLQALRKKELEQHLEK